MKLLLRTSWFIIWTRYTNSSDTHINSLSSLFTAVECPESRALDPQSRQLPVGCFLGTLRSHNKWAQRLSCCRFILVCHWNDAPRRNYCLLPKLWSCRWRLSGWRAFSYCKNPFLGDICHCWLYGMHLLLWALWSCLEECSPLHGPIQLNSRILALLKPISIVRGWSKNT